MSRRIFPDDLVNTVAIIDRIDEIEDDHISRVTGELGEIAPPYRAEYDGLKAIIDALGKDGRRHGVTLIHERHFTAYIKDLYLETGREYHEYDREGFKMVHVTNDELFSRMPFRRIDWNAVAQDEWSDYSQIEIDGDTYLYQGE